jgi:hypothetical protein
VQPRELEAPDTRLLQQLLFSPNEQVQELQAALAILSSGSGNSSGSQADTVVVQEMTAQVVDALMARAAQRLGVPPATLFPMRGAMLSVLQRPQPL